MQQKIMTSNLTQSISPEGKSFLFPSKDKRPFVELVLEMDSEKNVLMYLEVKSDDGYLQIVDKSKQFLKGFYSSFGLELLSTIDFIAQHQATNDSVLITEELENWSNRKKTLFSNPKFITLALNRLENSRLILQPEWRSDNVKK